VVYKQSILIQVFIEIIDNFLKLIIDDSKTLHQLDSELIDGCPVFFKNDGVHASLNEECIITYKI
jgi:hypothetical protein